jgi:hypothetical protein
MIASWKDFLVAVEEMRQCQKTYFLTKTSASLIAAKKREAVVDACIEKKYAEWDQREKRGREKQPELMEVTHE